MDTPEKTDVRTMPAGPELDALVVEKVMGWRWTVGESSHKGRVIAWPYPDRSGIEFEPSTDIDAAFLVLRKVTGRKHWRYELYNHDGTGSEEGACWCRIRGPGVDVEAAGGINDPATDDWEKSEEPVAICRAALLAVEGRCP